MVATVATNQLTAAKAASLAGVSVQTVARWAKDGRFRFRMAPAGGRRGGKRRLIDAASFRRWLKERAK